MSEQKLIKQRDIFMSVVMCMMKRQGLTELVIPQEEIDSATGHWLVAAVRIDPAQIEVKMEPMTAEELEGLH